MDNDVMNRSIAIVAIVALAVLVITATAINQDAFAKCKKKNSKYTQAIAQANVCGNGSLPLNIRCQNLANQIQGDDNTVNVIGVQP